TALRDKLKEKLIGLSRGQKLYEISPLMFAGDNTKGRSSVNRATFLCFFTNFQYLGHSRKITYISVWVYFLIKSSHLFRLFTFSSGHSLSCLWQNKSTYKGVRM
ncbi:MAG TPA: hypothetical protein DGQ36_01080, partial [Enterococcus sp.]|nr:hypothetical protein [Enterococcus sp.]